MSHLFMLSLILLGPVTLTMLSKMLTWSGLKTLTGVAASGVHVWAANDGAAADVAGCVVPGDPAAAADVQCHHHLQAATKGARYHGDHQGLRHQCQVCEGGHGKADGDLYRDGKCFILGCFVWFSEWLLRTWWNFGSGHLEWAVVFVCVFCRCFEQG